MRAAGISGRRPRAGRPWSSYAGETDDRPANAPRERAAARRAAGEDFRLAHDFSAPAPGELAVTDVTEFSIPAGEGLPLARHRLLRRGAGGVVDLAAPGLRALRRLPARLPRRPARGGRRRPSTPTGGATYRSASWKAIAGERGAARSMSRKACCQDNARAEGFFGTLKEEFFYGRDWSGASLAAFEEELDGVPQVVRDRAPQGLPRGRADGVRYDRRAQGAPRLRDVGGPRWPPHSLSRTLGIRRKKWGWLERVPNQPITRGRGRRRSRRAPCAGTCPRA